MKILVFRNFRSISFALEDSPLNTNIEVYELRAQLPRLRVSSGRLHLPWRVWRCNLSANMYLTSGKQLGPSSQTFSGGNSASCQNAQQPDCRTRHQPFLRLMLGSLPLVAGLVAWSLSAKNKTITECHKLSSHSRCEYVIRTCLVNRQQDSRNPALVQGQCRVLCVEETQTMPDILPSLAE